MAIIMDGNGRWATQRGLPRIAGHRAGVKRIRQAIKSASGLGIEVITFFVFSTENWQRPKSEVNMLMRFLSFFFNKEINELHKKNVRFRVIGRGSPLPREILEKIKAAEKLTAKNQGLTVVLALNYGGRAEIVDAAVRLAEAASRGRLKPSQLNEKIFSDFLYAPELPEPDLFIRTGGELRVSNFLLWELAYSELYFTRKFWPDFCESDLLEALREYQNRQRRYGRVC